MSMSPGLLPRYPRSRPPQWLLNTFPYHEDYFSVPISLSLYIPLKTALKLSHDATAAAQTGERQEK